MEILRGAREKRTWNLRQHARAVTAFAIGSHATAMRHIAHRGQRHAQNIVTHRTRKLRDKANAAGIMLEARIVQAAPLHPREALHVRHSSSFDLAILRDPPLAIGWCDRLRRAGSSVLKNKPS